MRLKKMRNGLPYVDPPHRSWPYKLRALAEVCELRATQILDDAHWKASTAANVSDWFDRVGNELDMSP